ncbi:MAG: hypothetical protein HOG41_21905 [Gammaproteobacteria bacterium]|nr:hypothetical protein [Gammaproteobacteria bacterium]MBT3726036.1 hypothetical protein [Gammaproteobacteria bacterium]MBT4196679.1 hypothetical protein [Gammaproteobacteria bacterium]MBT4448502.1 hypothetical protein [Gammaproteobacteria bacterium]
MVQHPTRIFLLSHMRAYSSLIGHILGSHPEIDGYYEMHISYQNNRDLIKQETVYSQQESFKSGSHFLFDKLLHNKYKLNLQQLELKQPRILVTLRSPEKTIKSIIHLFQKKEQQRLYANPQEATKYYIQRLQQLSEFCQINSQLYYYFDAELIRSNSTAMLATLTQWLQLESPLNDQYQLFSKTGKSGAGDSSKSIQRGKIVTSTNSYSNIEISDELLESAEQAYRKFRSIMIEQSIEERSVN